MSAGWLYGDPWHGETDQEDEYRMEAGRRDRNCVECDANLDIEGHDPLCPVGEGGSDE